MKLKATPQDISAAWHEWHANKANGLRLGQYIWNMHGDAGQSWPALFNETDPTKAYTMAMLECIECDERFMVSK